MKIVCDRFARVCIIRVKNREMQTKLCSFSRLFVTDSQTDRDFMQILISPIKAEKKTTTMDTFFRRIYILSTKRDWLTVIPCFFFSFFAVPYTRSLSLTVSLARSVRFPSLSDFTELTVG